MIVSGPSSLWSRNWHSLNQHSTLQPIEVVALHNHSAVEPTLQLIYKQITFKFSYIMYISILWVLLKLRQTKGSFWNFPAKTPWFHCEVASTLIKAKKNDKTHIYSILGESWCVSFPIFHWHPMEIHGIYISWSTMINGFNLHPIHAEGMKILASFDADRMFFGGFWTCVPRFHGTQVTKNCKWLWKTLPWNTTFFVTTEGWVSQNLCKLWSLLLFLLAKNQDLLENKTFFLHGVKPRNISFQGAQLWRTSSFHIIFPHPKVEIPSESGGVVVESKLEKTPAWNIKI